MGECALRFDDMDDSFELPKLDLGPKNEAIATWSRADVETLLQWMDGEFAHLLQTGGDMESALTALILRWRRTETKRSKILDILFAQIPKDEIRDFIGALLTIKRLPNVRTLMPSLDRVVGRLRRQGIEITPQPDIVKGVVVMR